MLLTREKKRKIWLQDQKRLANISNIRFPLHHTALLSPFFFFFLFHSYTAYSFILHFVQDFKQKILSTEIFKVMYIICHCNKFLIWDSTIWKSDQSNTQSLIMKYGVKRKYSALKFNELDSQRGLQSTLIVYFL